MASTLRSWLKKQDIYDKNIESALTSQGINDPETDFASFSQKDWDSLYRKCVVERAKELKDQKAKLRLEKKMVKLEKHWRQCSGIKKTSITKSQKKGKGTSTKSKSKTKSKKKSNGDGTALRQWMKENKVWEKTLFETLTKEEIVNADGVGSLSQSKFDDIVRVVRVQKFSELKDQKARQRVDKLLVHFEKLWRSMNSQNAVNAQNGVKDSEQKETEDGKSGNGSNGKSAMSTLTVDSMHSYSKSAGKEILPWYLSGKRRNKSNSAMMGNTRTPHQKKKDNKLNDKLRESAKVELEWIEIYSRSKYGGYIPPPSEPPKYGKKKRAKQEENVKENPIENPKGDDVEEKEMESNPIPNLHEMERDFGYGMVVDVCLEMLLTLHESWEGRVSILNELVDQLCDAQCSDDQYALKMSHFLYAIGHQFTDPRSLIIQALEKQIGRLATTTPTRFIVFAPYILTAAFSTFPVRIEALRDPGIRLGAFLIRTLSEHDAQHELLNAVIEGLNSKQAAVRTECADYVDFMIRNIGCLEKEDATESEVSLLAQIDTAVKKACGDAASGARMNGYRALNQYKVVAPKAAQQIIEGMTKAKKSKFDDANADPHWQISLKENSR